MPRKKSYFKIPKSFELLNHEIKIEQVENLVADSGNLGSAHSLTDRIQIQKSSKGMPITQDQKIHTLLHELTHSILCAMGQNELNQDEVFVDGFSGLLAQFFKSAKY